MFLGFYKHESEEDGLDIMAVWDDVFDFNGGNYTCYAYIGEHSGMSREYFKECTKITQK
jgi:hypothetical protein